MSIEYKEGNVALKCDMCGHAHVEKEGQHNDKFFYAGWGLYPNAKKYKHKCWNCRPVEDKLVPALTQTTNNDTTGKKRTH